MRHSKAGPYTETDHERTLTSRGRRDASEAGAWLGANSLLPDLALVSSATRTIETWEAVAAASGSQVEADFRDTLYNASVREVIEELTGVPEDVERLLYIGHNPTAWEVAHVLDDGAGAVDARRQLWEGYPTSALTVFDVAVPWAELERDSCRVVHFHVGRG